MKTNDGAGRHRKLSHRGIRTRVYLYLMLFGIGLVLVLWMFQIVFLDSIYRWQRTVQITRCGEQLVQTQTEDGIRALGRRLAVANDFSFRLLNSDTEEILGEQFGTRYSMIHNFSRQQLQEWCEAAGSGPITREFETNLSLMENPADLRPGLDSHKRVKSADETPAPTPEESRQGPQSAGERILGLQRDSGSAVVVLVHAAPVTLEDGRTCTLLLYTQLTPVSSTVDTLRTELIIITAVVILGMLLLAYVISSRVSLPIIETNTAARSLSRAAYERPRHADGYREISELNDTLEKAAEELGKVEQLQHELIANISHDLRTPLTMIGGYAEAMRDIPDENTPETMQIIIDETARLSTLVNELLDFSRLQTGSIPMNPVAFDLTEETRGIVARVGGLTAKDGYRIVFEPEEELTVTADVTRIGQVIYNLLGNALTYTGADKTVTVTQTRREGRARIAITDTGKGIAPSELPLIWNRYYRTRESHRRAIIGSGLGLNIVRTILEQHRTPYGVDSREGQGTTFWFELPLAEK